MTLTDFVDNFGATLDKDDDAAKDFPVFIQFEYKGQTITLEPNDVRFDYNENEVVISAEE